MSRAELATILCEVDLVLLTATDVERKALFRAIQPLPGESALIEGDVGHVTCRVGHFGRYYAAHIECAMGSTGHSGSTLTVAQAIGEINPRAMVVLGIAFGVDRKRQRFGDVIIAESVIPYEPGRAGRRFEPRGQPLPCGPTLSERFRTRRADWKEQRGVDHVNVFQGPLLSGAKVIDNLRFRRALQRRFPGASGGEMEGAGAYEAAANGPVEIILVKSISDWADGKKSDRAQAFASHTAVSLALHVLGKPDVLGKLGARDRGAPGPGVGLSSEPSVWAPLSARRRLVQGIDSLRRDWATRISSFLEAYTGTEDQLNVFCGREDDVDAVRTWLARPFAPPNLVITAQAGRGKSALLVRLERRTG